MSNVLHWVGVVIGLLVVIGGIRFFLRGLEGKPGDTSSRPAAKGRTRQG